MDDLFQNPEDSFAVEPAELGPLFDEVLTSSLAKSLAPQYGKQWTDAQETELQAHIAELVAAANALGVKTFRLNVTRRDGSKESREMIVEKINKTRSLQ